MPRRQKHMVAPSPSYPGYLEPNATWNDHYQERAEPMPLDYVNPNSTRRRSRSADARPQYKDRSGTAPRVSCMNVFYPNTQESRARVTYDVDTAQLPSELPKPTVVYHNEYDRGRSLSPVGSRYASPRNHSSGGTRRQPSSARATDPYSSLNIPLPSTLQSQRQPYPYERDQLKNSLIMFGEEQSSTGSGLSEQELLQKRGREDVTSKRRRNKNKSPKRVVQMPSNLFQSTSSSYQQEPIHQQSSVPSTPTSQRRSPQPSGTTGVPRMSSPDPPVKTSTAVPVDTPEDKGWRGSMVRRMRDQSSSSGRRWNIIPSLSKSRSGSQSPGRSSRRSPNIGDPTVAVQSARHRSPARGVAPPEGPSPNKSRSTADGSTSYQLDSPRKRLDPPSRMSYDTAEDDEFQTNNDWSFEEPTTNDVTQPSVGGTTSLFTPEKEPRLDVGNEGITANNGPGSEFSSFSMEPSFYTSRESIPFDLTKGQERDHTKFSKPSPPAKSLATSFVRKVAEDAMASNTGSPNTSASLSSIDRTPESRKPTTRYTLEPKDYTKLTARARQKRKNQNRSRQSPTMNSVSTAASTEVDYRQTKAYTNFDDKYMPSVLNPPDSQMELYTAYGREVSFTPDKEKHPMSQGAPEKTSPTSVADLNNTNVHWSEKQDPATTPRPRTVLADRPKSILRRKGNRRLNADYNESDCPSDESTVKEKAVRISDKPASRGQFISDHPSAMGFVDGHGRALSPILSMSFDDDNAPSGKTESDEKKKQAASPKFGQSIPEDVQRAFLDGNEVSTVESNPGAYADFIVSVASVVVQTAVRQFLAKCRVQRMRGTVSRVPPVPQREKAQPLASKQAVSRSSLLTARNIPQHRLLFMAAVRIQSVFRGWYARDYITVDNYCASIIQRAFRTHRCRMKYLYDRYRVVTVQSIARRKFALDLHATCMYCIVVIQAAFRGHIVRKRTRKSKRPNTHNHYMIYHTAATVIQAQWRSFSCEIKFLRAYESILLVQSIARGWVTRRLIRSWLRAHKIQASSRLLGEGAPRRSQPAAPFRYDLPRSYMNHTEFMKMSLPPPVQNLEFEAPPGEVGVDRTGRLDPQGSFSPNRSSQPGIASRAARAEMGRRKRENELLRKASYEEEQHRVATSQGDAQKQRRRRELKAHARQQYDLHRRHVAMGFRSVSQSDSNLSDSSPFDEQVDEQRALDPASSTIYQVRGDSEPTKRAAGKEETQKVLGSVAHTAELRRRRMERTAHDRRAEQDKGGYKTISIPGDDHVHEADVSELTHFDHESDQQQAVGNSAAANSGGLKATNSRAAPSRESSTSKLLAGWREKEKRNSFDHSEAAFRRKQAKEGGNGGLQKSTAGLAKGDSNQVQHSQDPSPNTCGSTHQVEHQGDTLLANGGVRKQTESPSQMTVAPLSAEYFARHSRRSLAEQRRIEHIHSKFHSVGLTQRAPLVPAQSQSVLPRAPNDKIVRPGKVHQLSSDEYSDEKKDEVDNGPTGVASGKAEQAADTVTKNEKAQKSPWGVRPSLNSKLGRISRSFEPAADEPTSRVDDLVATPDRCTQVSEEKETPQPPVPHATPSFEDVWEAVDDMPPTPQRPSPLHAHLRAKRSDSEQQRIDAMHTAFHRVGLLGGRRRRVLHIPQQTSAPAATD